MFIKSLFLTALVLVSSTSASDIQAYPGLQFRIQESFLDLITKEFFYQLPLFVDPLLNSILPDHIDFLNFRASDFGFHNFTIDPSRADFTINKDKHGIMMNWAEVTWWNFHAKFTWNWLLFKYAVKLDVNIKEGTLDNGLSIQANDHTGAPEVNFFNTYVNLGKSYIELHGDFVAWIIGWLSNIFKSPLQLLVNEFFQPFANWAINSIIIPKVLHNGIFEIPIVTSDSTDSLVIDISLPEDPVFYNETMDVFTDAAIFFKNEGETYKPPTTPMRFQLNDYNFQFVTSAFTVNNVLETIIQTGWLEVPIYYNLLEKYIGFDITTTLLSVIVPEMLFYYGSKNVSFVIQPVTGTQVSWSSANQTTATHVSAITSFYVHEGVNQTMTLAFEALMDIDVQLGLQIGANKTVNLTLSELDITGFNITKDNCYTKSDESGIKFRLNQVMNVIEATVNAVLKASAFKLPDLIYIDYEMAFDYQDGAFGTGIKVTEKQQ